MNFKELMEETRKSLTSKRKTDAFFLNMAIEEIREQTNKVYVPGWEIADFDESKISNFYINFRACLQFIGMGLMDGNEERDKTIFDDLTEVLAALREVIIRNFQIELPPARVVFMVTKAVEEGFLEEFRDEDGVLRVKPNENHYNIRIKIIKTPDGPVPEEFKQKEVGLVLPARRLSNTGLMKGYDECYRVPKIEFIEALRQVSTGVADCLANLFPEDESLLFHIDEAKIVP